MSNHKPDKVGGMDVGHADIPKFLYVVYIGMMLWAGYYFTLDSDTIAYERPLEPLTAIYNKYGCMGCHPGMGPDLKNVKNTFKSKEDLAKFLEDPVKARNGAGQSAVMKSVTDRMAKEDKEKVVSELMK